MDENDVKYILEKRKVANALQGVDPNSNFAQNYGTYSPPGANYIPFQGSQGDDLGFVAPKKVPNTAFYRNAPNINPTVTKGHEAAHLQANIYDPVARRESLKGNYSPMAIGHYRAHKDLLNGVKEFYGNSRQGQVSAHNMGRSEEELLAELQGIEASLPRGSNVFDAAQLRNETNQQFIRKLEQSMLPTMPKMFPPDSFEPVPHAQKPDTNWIQQLQQLMRNFTK